MAKISLTNVTGDTPISVYVADYYGNNKQFLGIITGDTMFPVPPEQNYFPNSIFDSAPTIMLILQDINGCEKFKLIDCSVGFIAIRTETFIPIATETGIILIP